MTAQHPVESRPVNVGIIGGTGQMGAMFHRLLEADGCRVMSLGRHEDPSYTELVTQSDVVIISVPIDKTVPLVERITPHLRPDQLLSDFTSIKVTPVQAMLKTPSWVIGCHPLFAPMKTLEGQNVVLCPENPGPWLPWYRGFFERHGMAVSEMSPSAHDEAMSFIQGLTHFINITFARTLQTRQADLEQILKICSPVYQVFFALLCRILSGDPVLYGQIQVSNPHNFPVLDDFLENADSLVNSVKSGDSEGIYKVFNEAAQYLGDFKQVARQESDFLIEQMALYLKDGKEGGGGNEGK